MGDLEDIIETTQTKAKRRENRKIRRETRRCASIDPSVCLSGLGRGDPGGGRRLKKFEEQGLENVQR